MRVVRKALLWSGAVVLVVFLLLLVLPHFLHVGAYRAEIESRLTEALGRRVTIGKVDLSLLGGVRLNLEDVALHPVRGKDPQEFFQARELRIHLKFLPLLFKEIRVASITMESPDLRLEEPRTALAGRPSRPGRPENAAPQARLALVSTAAAPGAGEVSPPWSRWERISLGRLLVNKGKVSFFGRGPEPLFTLTDLNLSASNLSLKGNIRYHLQATLTYRGTESYDFSGDIFPSFSRGKTPEVDFSLNSPAVDVDSLVSLSRLLRRLPAGTTERGGPGAPAAPSASLWNRLILTGRIQIKKVLFKGFKMVDLEARVRREKDQVWVNSLSLRAAGGLVRAQGRVGIGPRDGQLSLKGSLEQVEAQTLLSGLTGQPSPLSGPLNLKVQIASLREGVKNLSGNASVLMGPGRFEGKKLEAKLQTYGRLLFSDPRKASLRRYEKISGDLRIGKGEVTTRNLTGLWPGFRVVLRGSMNFQGLADLKAAVTFLNHGILRLKVRGPMTRLSVLPDLGESGPEVSLDAGRKKKSIEGVFKKLFRSLKP